MSLGSFNIYPYLKGRGNVVVIGDHKTEWISMTCGDTRGSIFIPLLFIQSITNQTGGLSTLFLFFNLYLLVLLIFRKQMDIFRWSSLAEDRWNQLPDDFKCTSTLATLKCKWKTQLNFFAFDYFSLLSFLLPFYLLNLRECVAPL